jgi:uncharacterized protein
MLLTSLTPHRRRPLFMNPIHNREESHFNRARASLRQTLSWYNRSRQSRKSDLSAALRGELQVLESSLEKLEQGIIRIATFGSVSRGKSAIINSLIGQKVLPTGPLHGVTQWPRSVYWQPKKESKVQIELIDTPGLDEIDGEARSQIAKQVASQADLILFVIAGDLTRTEYKALCELRQAQKPLILVFNKVDLYPDSDRQTIYEQLLRLGTQNPDSEILTQLLSPEEIVMVAAEPAPIQVREEWIDGKVTTQWENPIPQIDELRRKIWQILNREGRSLIALNALVQAREAESHIARKSLDLLQPEAEELIWRYAKYKALAVAINPIAILDILAGTATDLALIRALAKLYNLPIAGYQMGQLLRSLALSFGTLTLGELGSSLLLGFGKSALAISSSENPAHITGYLGTAIAQAGIAGYGTYIVGKAAQVYLERGCNWGEFGSNAVIEEILAQVPRDTIVYRLRQELQAKSNLF